MSVERRRHRWRGVYAVDGIGKVGPDELPPDVAALLDVAQAARELNVTMGEMDRFYWPMSKAVRLRTEDLHHALAALEALPTERPMKGEA